MKSRTLSSEKTLFLKNITRFMPFWALYIVCLLLGLMMLSAGDKEFYIAIDMGECTRIMALVNCGYALLVAQLLFGDLYDSRMCSGIHCLPLRREAIFAVNVGAGLLFSLVPTLIMALASLPMMLNTVVVDGWQLSFLWLLAANLQYVFFFGLAIFCTFLAGNRLAMAVIYGILNLWSVLVMLVIEAMYMPMLRGVAAAYRGFELLSPVVHITTTPLVYVERLTRDAAGTFRLEPGWAYLWICAGVGLVLMALGLVLYRHRKLERAGEFVAVKALRPVFLVTFSLAAACGFALVNQFFFSGEGGITLGILLAVVGLIVGWFVGAMLLAKSTRVFHKKSILGGGILLGVLLGSFLLTWLDPLGIRTWLPDPEDVAWVRITDGENYYGVPSAGYGNYYGYENTDPSEYPNRLTDRENIGLAVELHRRALEEGLSRAEMDRIQQEYTAVGVSRDQPWPTSFSLEYTMKDGSVVRRYYSVLIEGETGRLLAHLQSQPESRLGWGLAYMEAKGAADYIQVDGYMVPDRYLTEKDTVALKQAVLADCREGHMAANWDFHGIPLWEDRYGFYMEIGSSDSGVYLTAFGDSVHTLQWLEDRGILDTLRERWEQAALEQ